MTPHDDAPAGGAPEEGRCGLPSPVRRYGPCILRRGHGGPGAHQHDETGRIMQAYHAPDTSELRAAHQERDADARRLDALDRRVKRDGRGSGLLELWSDIDGMVGIGADEESFYTDVRAAIDAAIAPDTQTGREDRMDADGWFEGWPDAHMEKPDDEIRTMAGTSGLDFIRGLRLRDIYLRLRRIEEILATGAERAEREGGEDE